MRSSEDVPCASQGPCSRAPQVLGSLDSSQTMGFHLRPLLLAVVPRLCFVWDSLWKGIFWPLVHPCSVLKHKCALVQPPNWDKEDSQTVCFPLEGGIEMSEVYVFFFQQPLYSNVAVGGRAGIYWVFVPFLVCSKPKIYWLSKIPPEHQNCYVVCMPLLVLFLDCSMNGSITDVCSFCAFMVFSLFESSCSDLVKSRAFQRREVRAFSFQNLSHTQTSGYTHPYWLRFVYKNLIFFQNIS